MRKSTVCGWLATAAIVSVATAMPMTGIIDEASVLANGGRPASQETKDVRAVPRYSSTNRQQMSQYLPAHPPPGFPTRGIAKRDQPMIFCCICAARALIRVLELCPWFEDLVQRGLAGVVGGSILQYLSPTRGYVSEISVSQDFKTIQCDRTDSRCCLNDLASVTTPTRSTFVDSLSLHGWFFFR